MKTTKKVLSVLLAALLIVPSLYIQVVAAPNVWGGDAFTSWYEDYPEETVYEIGTAEELAGLAVLVNSDNTLAGKTIKLTSDIYLNDVSDFATWGTSAPTREWTPIGYYDGSSWHKFAGNIDGQGHTIYGMYINSDGSNRSAFLTTIDGSATIKDLKFENAYVVGKSGAAAVLVAQPSGSNITVKNVDVSNSYVKAPSGDGGAFLIGNIGSYSNISFDGCDVTNSKLDGNAKNGAILGNNAGSGAVNITFSNITVEGCTINAKESAGLISGYFAGGNTIKFSNVVAKGTLGSTTAGSGIGGIAGRFAKATTTPVEFNDVYVEADITGNGDGIGGMYGRSAANVPLSFNNCYVGGTVTNVSTTVSSGTSNGTGTGGFIGSWVHGSDNAISFNNCLCTATVKATDNAGGFIGQWLQTRVPLQVKDSMFTGTVISENDYGALIGEQTLNGGYNKKMTINNFYYNATFKNNAGTPLTPTLGTFQGSTASTDGAAMLVAGAKFYTPQANSETAEAVGGVVAKANATADCSEFFAALDPEHWSPSGELIFKTYWDGSADTSWYDDAQDVFEIDTAKKLAGFAELVDGGKTFEGKTVKLTSNIYLNDTTSFANWGSSAPATNWNPIGKYQDAWFSFNGTFDGQGHTIYGMYMSGQNRSGFFSTVGGSAVIKNVDFEGAYVTAGGSGSAVVIAQPAGGTSLTISNVNVNNFYVKGTSNDGTSAIVANISSYSTPVVIENCNVTNGTLSGAQHTAAIAGQYAGSGMKAFSITDINVDNVTVSGTAYSAGVAGQIKGATNAAVDFKNIKVNATVTGNSEGIGGIMGSSNGAAIALTFDNCYFTGSINNTSNRTGGILGCFNNGDTQTTTIKNCLVDATIQGKAYIGGLIGYGIHNDHKFVINDSAVMGTIVSTDGGAYGALIGDYGKTKDDVDTFTISNFYYDCEFSNGEAAITPTLGTFEKGTDSFATTPVFYTPLENSDIADKQTDAEEFWSVVDPTYWSAEAKGLNFIVKWDGETVDTSWYNDTDTTFYISNAAQLAGIAQIVNATPGNYFTGKTVILKNNIDLGGYEWTPIGKYDGSYYVFNGTFDGDGHIIANMKVGIEGKTGNDRYGMFAWADTGTFVKNLIINKANVSGKEATGIVIGQVKGGTFTLSNVSVFNSYATSTSGAGLGGLVGRVGSYTNILIEDCFVNAEIVFPGTASYAGGILGLVPGVGTAQKLTIKNCETNNTFKGNQAMGGIIGGYQATATSNKAIEITGCTTNDSFDSTYNNNGKTNRQNFGGVIAYITKPVGLAVTISDTDVAGTMIACQNSAAMIGRIANEAGMASLTVTNCTSNYFINGTAADIAIDEEAGVTSAISSQCLGSIIGLAQNSINAITINGYTSTDTIISTGGNIGILASLKDIGTINATDVIVKSDLNANGNIGGLIGSLANVSISDGVATYSDTQTAITVDGYYFDGSIISGNDGYTGGLFGTVTSDGVSVNASNVMILGTLNSRRAGAFAGNFGTEGYSADVPGTITLANFYFDQICKDQRSAVLFYGYRGTEIVEDFAYSTLYEEEKLPTDSLIAALKDNMPAAVQDELTGRASASWVEDDVQYRYSEANIISDECQKETDMSCQMFMLGASIRVEDPYGMRFAARVRNNQNLAIAGYGMLIIPEDILDGAELTVETEKVADVPAEVFFENENADYRDNYQTFSGVLIGIPEEAFNREICARAYVKFEDGTYLYTDTITRTYKGVAKACYASQAEDIQATLDEIFGTGFAD